MNEETGQAAGGTSWQDAEIQEGFRPEAKDASDLTQTEFVGWETRSRRRMVIGTTTLGDTLHTIYDIAATQVGIAFDQVTGRHVHVHAKSVDDVSGERVHLDQYRPITWGRITHQLDNAFTANNRESATARRRSVKTGKKRYKTIG